MPTSAQMQWSVVERHGSILALKVFNEFGRPIAQSAGNIDSGYVLAVKFLVSQ